MPKVSVITPAYNASAYINEAIESILNQTLNDLEFIIIDDCSTDDTWHIIQQYARRDTRIIAERNPDNLGIAGNRNKGVLLAKSPYIAWQDADDISIPTRLEKQYRFMETHPAVGILGGYLHFFDDKGYSSVRRYCQQDENLRRSIFRYSPVPQPAAMIRRRCFDEVGLYDLNCPPAEDLDMSFRIGMKYQFANLPEVLVHYRENVQSATFTKLKVTETRTITIRRRYARSGQYKITYPDAVYNLVQTVALNVLPAKWKIRLFNLLRNTKNTTSYV